MNQPAAAPAAAQTAQPAATLPDFTTLVRKYGRAVVNVVSTREVKPDSATPRGFSQDPLDQFFRRFGLPQPRAPRRSPEIERGEGSGFIVSADGYVLTNAHVVDDTSKVRVKLPDKREFDAKVVGEDSASDVAVLKLDAQDLPTVMLGDSSKLQPGQWVAAIGALRSMRPSRSNGSCSRAVT